MKWGCFGKIKIKSKDAARKAARRKDNLTWYFCDNCYFYHTGRK